MDCSGSPSEQPHCRWLHVFFRRTGLVTFLVPSVIFLAAPVVFLAAPVVFLVARLVAVLVVSLAVETAFLPVSTGSGGNHTTLVALTFAMNEAPRAAHFSRSVTPFSWLLISIICCSLPDVVLHCRPALIRKSISGSSVSGSPPPPCPPDGWVTPGSMTPSRGAGQSHPWSGPPPRGFPEAHPHAHDAMRAHDGCAARRVTRASSAGARLTSGAAAQLRGRVTSPVPA